MKTFTFYVEKKELYSYENRYVSHIWKYEVFARNEASAQKKAKKITWIYDLDNPRKLHRGRAY